MIIFIWLRQVRADLSFRTTRRHVVSFLLSNPGFRCLMLLRMQAIGYQYGRYRLSNYLRFRILAKYALDCVPGCTIGKSFRIEHPVGIVIGKGVVIGDFVTLSSGVTLGEKYTDGRSEGIYPRIGNRITIGAGSTIVGDVHVGDDTTIGAGSIVLASVRAGSTITGLHK